MAFVEITRFYPFPNNKYDNYYYNRLFKILKRVVLRPLYFAFLELLINSSSPVEVQLLLPKSIFEISSVSIIFVATLP